MRTQPATASQVDAVSKVCRRSAPADAIKYGKTTAAMMSATINQSIARIGLHSCACSFMGFEV